MSNNAPDYLLPLTGEQLQFLKDNCGANIVLGLQLLQDCKDRGTAEKLVALNQNFKGILDACKKAEER